MPSPSRLAARLREGGYHDQARNLRRAVETMGLPLHRPGNPRLVVELEDDGYIARLVDGGQVIADEQACHHPRGEIVEAAALAEGPRKKVTLWMPEELWEALGRCGPNKSREVVEACLAHVKAKGL